MSSFVILSIACMTASDFSSSSSCSSSGSNDGTTCHDRPYLSWSQPHWPGWPPSESRSQKMSTSSCVLHSMENEIAGPADGVVQSIEVKAGQTVAAGAVLAGAVVLGCPPKLWTTWANWVLLGFN